MFDIIFTNEDNVKHYLLYRRSDIKLEINYSFISNDILLCLNNLLILSNTSINLPMRLQNSRSHFQISFIAARSTAELSAILLITI